MNTYDYTYKSGMKKLTLSVNKHLVTAAKEKRINLSAFLESKLEELLIKKKEMPGAGFGPATSRL